MRTAPDDFSTATRLFLLTTLADLGERIRDDFRSAPRGMTKSNHHDLVTELDRSIQDELSDRLRHYLPGSTVFAEEDFSTTALPEVGAAFADQLNRSAALWVVDPIDGTSNFVHGFPFFAISVALWQPEGFVAAAVLNPITGEAFSADLSGAYLETDGAPERRLGPVRGRTERNAALTTSHPAAEVLDANASEHLAIFADLVAAFASVRRPICAALELCYVAAGFSDATLAVDSKAWDAAAGWFIAAQAGARLSPYWYGQTQPLPGFAAPCYVAAGADYPTLTRAAQAIARLRSKDHDVALPACRKQ